VGQHAAQGRFLIRVAAVLLVMHALANPPAALAQGSTWIGASLAQVLDEAAWRLGFLRVNAGLDLSSVGHDSDIYYGYFEKAYPDFVASTSLPVQVLAPVAKTVLLEFADRPEYAFYVDTKNERAWNNTFTGYAHLSLKDVYIRAGGGSANVRQRLSPELDINVRERSEGFDGLVLWQASRASSYALLYRQRQYRYGDALWQGVSIGETLDRREDHVNLLGYLQPSPRVRFSLNGRYGAFTFSEPVSTFKNAKSYGVFAGFDFIPREEAAGRISGIRGRASLGYIVVRMDRPDQADGSGLAGDVDVAFGLMSRTTAHVFFSRGFQFSIFSGATYYFSTAYGAGLSRYFSRRVSLSYELSLGQSTYPEIAEGGAPSGIGSHYTTHLASLRLVLSRNLTLSLLGTIGKRTIPGAGLDSRRNFFGFSLFYGTAMSTISSPSVGMAP
jgi:hypothetical protein